MRSFVFVSVDIVARFFEQKTEKMKKDCERFMMILWHGAGTDSCLQAGMTPNGGKKGRALVRTYA